MISDVPALGVRFGSRWWFHYKVHNFQNNPVQDIWTQILQPTRLWARLQATPVIFCDPPIVLGLGLY